MDDRDLAQALGRMEGKLDIMLTNQARQDEKLGEMDERLRKVEIKAAQTGAVTGGITAVFTAVGIEVVKRKLGF